MDALPLVMPVSGIDEVCWQLPFPFLGMQAHSAAWVFSGCEKLPGATAKAQ
jgi:hypothetical protein